MGFSAMKAALFAIVTVNGVSLAWHATTVARGVIEGALPPIGLLVVVLPLIIGAVCCLITGFVGLSK